LNGEVYIVEDVAAAFGSLLIEDFRNRKDQAFSLAVSGGETAKVCYQHLAKAHAYDISWWDVDVYWGDERCVPPDHPDSNELLVRRYLLEQVGGANAVYPMRCDEGPEAYQLRIGHLEGMDFIHLGFGPDGHTASLFPGSKALEADPGLLVAFNEDPAGRNPHKRMTLTYSAISRAEHVVFTVAGEAKRDAYRALLDGADLPAGRVTAKKVTWLVSTEVL
jgi:6-phosphogluconolactonase